MIKVYALSFLLIAISFLHFAVPNELLKVMPPFIPFPQTVILLTGVLEIILAVGLICSRTRYATSLGTAIYFVLLFPVHIYMIQSEIPLAGISNPAFLWGRLFFQFILVYWAYSVRFLSRSTD